jgi:hypothetical protein
MVSSVVVGLASLAGSRVECSELPGVPCACQMESVGKVKTLLELVQGLGYADLIFQEHRSEPCQTPQSPRHTLRRDAAEAKGPSVSSSRFQPADSGAEGRAPTPKEVDLQFGPFRAETAFPLPFRGFHPATAGLLMACPFGALPPSWPACACRRGLGSASSVRRECRW